MSRFIETGKHNSFPAGVFTFPDFDVSWAGSSLPWRPGFCFGSEDGRIRFVEVAGTGGSVKAFPATTTDEAVNSVAFSGGMMAVSTRAEVVFWKTMAGPEEEVERTIYSGGAHEVIASRAGRFIAPLGTRGILITGPGFVDLKTTIVKPRGKPFYSYKVASLASGAEGESLIIAARREGIVISSVPSEGGGVVRMLKAPGSDIVDVCGLDSESYPLAAAALGIDRTVYLMRDVHDVGRTPTLRFPGLKGRAYRLLSAHGHLFMLTSEFLYAFPDLAARFLGDGRGDGPMMARALGYQAVDAYLADEWLLVVMPDSVISMKVDDFAAKYETRVVETSPEFEVPAWEQSASLPLDYAAI